MSGENIMNKSFEYQYYDVLKDIVENYNYTYQPNRTGIDTLVQQSVHFKMPDIMNNFPILRGKKVYPLMALKELLWMLNGRTDVQWLRDRKVTYWDEWEQKDGTIGKSYGYQFRNFNGRDNLNELYIEMLENPRSRRHILNIWNVNNLSEMALPPCMYDYNFNCLESDELNEDEDMPTTFYKVNLHTHIRSNDAFLGAPYDFMFCAWFNFITCMYLNWCVINEPENLPDSKFYSGDVYYTADNFHLYCNHVSQTREYIKNVEENKFHIIDVPTYIHYNNDTQEIGPEGYTSYKDPENLNLFLGWIEDYILQQKKITVTNKLREYGPIKADIAV